jgi:hypothetical protein
MRNVKKIFAYFSAFVLVTSGMFAQENKKAELPPIFLQSIRPFDSVSFSFTREESEDGKSWKTVARRKLTWDVKRNYIKIVETRIHPEDPTYMETRLRSQVNGKLIQVSLNVKAEPELPLSPKNILLSSGWISKANSTVLTYDDFLSFFYHGRMGQTHIHQTLSNEKTLLSLKLDLLSKPDVIGVMLNETNWFEIGKHNGLLMRKIYRFKKRDGTTHDEVTQTAEKHVFKNGWQFPIVLHGKFASNVSKIQWRYVVDPESLEINKKYAISDFSVEVPIGTQVQDLIENKTYKITRPLNSMDIANIEKQLETIIEEAQKKKP